MPHSIIGTRNANGVGRGSLRATESEIATSQYLEMKDTSIGQKPEYKRRMQIYPGLPGFGAWAAVQKPECVAFGLVFLHWEQMPEMTP